MYIWLYCSKAGEVSHQDSNISIEEILFNIERYINFITNQKQIDQCKNKHVDDCDILDNKESLIYNIFFYGNRSLEQNKIYGLYEYLRLLFTNYNQIKSIDSKISTNEIKTQILLLIYKILNESLRKIYNFHHKDQNFKQYLCNIIIQSKQVVIGLIFNQIYNNEPIDISHFNENKTQEIINFLQNFQKNVNHTLCNFEFTIEDYQKKEKEFTSMLPVNSENQTNKETNQQIGHNAIHEKLLELSNKNSNLLREFITSLETYQTDNDKKSTEDWKKLIENTSKNLVNDLSHTQKSIQIKNRGKTIEGVHSDNKSNPPIDQKTTESNKTFFSNHKKPLLIGGGIIIALIIALFSMKKFKF
jgi:hypothetical protein